MIDHKPGGRLRRLETKALPFTLKSADDSADGAVFEGIVACFCSIDLASDMFLPGCFAARLDAFKSNGVIRDEHCVTVGKVLDAAEVPEGLWIKGQVLPTTAGRDVAILLKNRAIKRLSIGSQNWGRWTDDVEEIKALWQQHGYAPTEDDLLRAGYGVRLIERSAPYEASTTWLPMNENTSITSVKSADPQARPTFDAHATQTLAAVEAFLERAEQLHALRQQDGRGLSQKSRARARQLIDRLTTLTTLPATEPPAEPDHNDDVQALYDEWQRLEARLNGVLV